MDLFTRVEAHSLPALHYTDQLVCLGSCFADRMGQLLQASRFQVVVNPLGVLFNPLTIAIAIERTLDPDPHISLELQEGNWVSLDYHSKMAAPTAEEVFDKITDTHTQLRSALTSAHWLVLTMGTAWIYRSRYSGKIVTNCHHFPASHFVRELLSVQAIVDTWKDLLAELRELNPALRVLLTVSPVRHLRDGMLDNSVSKSTLLLAANQLVQEVAEVYYFPAYEIMQDELRDYRFYEADMTQPSPTARQYIWERLGEVWFAPETQDLLAKIEQLEKMNAHIPRNTASETYKTFVENREALCKEIEEALAKPPTQARRKGKKAK